MENNYTYNIKKEYELEKISGEFLDYKFEVLRNQIGKINIIIHHEHKIIINYTNWGSDINEGVKYTAQLIENDINQRIYYFNKEKEIIEEYKKHGCYDLKKLIKKGEY